MKDYKLTENQKQFIFDITPKLASKKVQLELLTATELAILDIEVTEKEYDTIRRGGLYDIPTHDILEIFVIKSTWENKPDLVVYTISTTSIKYIKDYTDTKLPIFPITSKLEIRPNEIINFKKHNTRISIIR